MVFPNEDATPRAFGSRLCLGLVNTVLWRRSQQPVERLTSYDDLVHHVARAGWIDSPEALIAEAHAHPRKARAALGEAVAFRELLFGIFSDIGAGREPGSWAVATLGEHLAASMAQLALTPDGAGAFAVTWQPLDSLDVPLWQAAASAGSLLASDDLARVKQCPGEKCGWVFVDESRNQSRLWCDSTMCGNRARVRAHY